MNTEAQVNGKSLVIKIALVAAAIVLAAALFSWYNASREVERNNPAVMQGNVKMTEIDLNSMLDGYIEAVNVAAGDSVKEGDVLLQIEPDIVQAKVREAEAALGQAKAGLAQAQAVLSKAQNGARPEDVAQAKAAYDYAASTYERMKPLYADGAVSASDFEGIEAKYLAAKAVYETALNGARPEDIAQAQGAVQQYQATVKQAEAAVNEANTYLRHAVITAPCDGVVTAVNVEKGELISTGMSLASLRAEADAWVEVNVLETSLSLVRQGQQVTLSFPAYAEQSFHGTVVNVSKNPDFAVKKATNENGSFDVLSYAVKIRLDDMTEPLYAGMTAVVDFSQADLTPGAQDE